MDGLAVTDHNAIEGAIEAQSLAASEGLLVVRGVEVSSKEGHILALGVRELVPRGLPAAETIERIHSLGGIAVAAHPLRHPSGVGRKVAGSAKFDAIEIVNSASSPRTNRATATMATERGLPVTGGSDAHRTEEVGRAYTIFDGVGSEDEAIDHIVKRLTKADGRGRTPGEGVKAAFETLAVWIRGDFERM
jgi:predicted metal-dependent phosphoesterase TrpH